MKKSHYSLAIFLSFFISDVIFANQISKVSGAKALIDISDLDLKSGQEVYAVDDKGKKKAILRIDKIRGERATANIIKGKAKSGFYIELKERVSSSSRSSDYGSSRATSDSRLGLLIGITQNAMAIKLSSASYNLSGSGMTVSGFWDIPLSEGIFARGKAGIKQFTSASGTSKANFQYLGLEGSLNFKLGSTFWLGGGGAFLFSLAKDSNVVGLDISASTNSFFFGGVGANLRLGRSAIIPISIDYAMYPSGTGVSASSLLLRAGYAFDL